MVGIGLLTLALFHSFYYTARGGSPILGTFATIGLAITTSVGTVSIDAVLGVLHGLSVGAIILFWRPQYSMVRRERVPMQHSGRGSTCSCLQRCMPSAQCLCSTHSGRQRKTTTRISTINPLGWFPASRPNKHSPDLPPKLQYRIARKSFRCTTVHAQNRIAATCHHSQPSSV